MIILLVAAFFRFWQLGAAPAGLYRDEAFNGLDALDVLNGEHALFFPANNGREPLYIYLTALSTAIFGRTLFAVRAAAALTGTLTTLTVFLLGRSWFDRQTGLIAAWLWATTFAAVHLSRIGLRPVLLAPLLALSGWAAARAIRTDHWRWWALSGALYGLSFYTYIAVRFSPLPLLLLLLYALWQGHGRLLRRALPPFGAGALLLLLPLLLLFWQQPHLILGRAGQVSILEGAMDGSFWSALAANTGKALALFFWRGDTIGRHNLPGRPLFDPLLALPFLIGLWQAAHQWRRPPAAALLVWVLAMLGPTILAADTPHFLRVSGIYPAVMLLPALGLRRLWDELPLPPTGRRLLVLLLLIGSALLTWRDYRAYALDPQTALLFEAAATDLALQLEAESAPTAVYLDRWFWDEDSGKGWPAIPYLTDLANLVRFRPEFGLPPPPAGGQVSLYTWPFGDREFVPGMLADSDLVSVSSGAPVRNDLDTESYSFAAIYRGRQSSTAWPLAVNFSDQFTLHAFDVRQESPQQLAVTLVWSAAQPAAPLVAFAHVAAADGRLIGQLDAYPGGPQWFAHWWRPGQLVQETRQIRLDTPFDPALHTVAIGLYDPQTSARAPILDKNGGFVGESWLWTP